MSWNETIQALLADGEKMQALTGEDHGRWVLGDDGPFYGIDNGPPMPTTPHTTITVREWGTVASMRNGGDHIPYRLSDMIAELALAQAEIPPEHRATAHVDCEPDYEFGEHYEAMRVTYSRPMDADELAAYHVEERKHWEGQLAEAEQRVAYCRGELGV